MQKQMEQICRSMPIVGLHVKLNQIKTRVPVSCVSVCVLCVCAFVLP